MQRATIPSMPMAPEPETIAVPTSVRFPVELAPPPGFRPEDPATWPRVEGRLEFVDARLLYMPPCGDVQQRVAVSAVVIVGVWGEAHSEFVVGGNEAGMMFGPDVRGAEAAVWRRETLGPLTGGYVRVPPLLAVEVAGREEGGVGAIGVILDRGDRPAQAGRAALPGKFLAGVVIGRGQRAAGFR